MSHLDEDALAAVAIGDASAADDAHLLECSACAAQLQDLRDLMQALSSSGPAQALESPPASVWDAISAEVTSDRFANDEAVNDQTGTPSSNEGGGASSSASAVVGTDELARRRARKTSRLALMAAAAAGVVVGGVGVGVVLYNGAAEQAQVVASAPLTDLTTDAPAGDAVLHTRDDGTQVLVIDAQTPEIDDAYLEVWLIDESIEGMVSLGHLTSGSNEFAIPAGFDVSGFPIVDISVEPFDGVPTHSGDSVTRGVLDV